MLMEEEGAVLHIILVADRPMSEQKAICFSILRGLPKP